MSILFLKKFKQIYTKRLNNGLFCDNIVISILRRYKMPSLHLTNQGDIKLYILCIMQNVGYPLEYSDINDLSLYDQIITNMDFIAAFNDLSESGLIAKNEEGLYYVTDEGNFIVSNLRSELNGYIRERSLNSAMQYIAFRKGKIKKNVTVTVREDGKYDARFVLSKGKDTIMDITLTLDTEYQAKKMAVTFSEKPEMVYARLISILTGD